MFWLVRQYVFVIPLLSVVIMYLQCALSNASLKELLHPWTYCQLISTMVCFYGLIILYSSSHDLLHAWNPTKKFVAIKLFILALAWEEWLIEKFFVKFLHQHDSCFEEVGFVRDWASVEGKWWSMWLIVVQGIPMMLMMRAAFPASDLMEEIEEFHTDFLKHGVRLKKEEGMPVDNEVAVHQSEGNVHGSHV